MLQRFTREKAKKKGTAFDLEDGDEDEDGEGLLTHAGKALVFDDNGDGLDDFDAESVEGGSSDDEATSLLRKRMREADMESGSGDEDPDQPERKKSKAEVMKEVIAKSKLYKYERQQAKEEDDELRERLDKELPDLLALIRGQPLPTKAPSTSNPPQSTGDFSINPDRAVLIQSGEKENADKEYDQRLRQLVLDRRAKPTERTKTDEEKAQEEAARLQELEEKRQRRMRGEQDESEEEAPTREEIFEGDEDYVDEAAEFGFTNSYATSQNPGTRPEGVDDEDDFILDDDLSANESDLDEMEGESDEEQSQEEGDGDEDYEFIQEQYLAEATGQTATSSQLAFTYPCPQTHDEFLNITAKVAIADVPTVIQRIRALYAPQLAAGNKEKLGVFSSILVDHIQYMASAKPPTPLSILETVIRHIHSLSRTHPEAVARQFRLHLKRIQGVNNITPSDLVIFTAIGSIYPASDHFHQVVTPAITLIGRWLGLTIPKTTQDLSIGAYLVTLCLKYQSLSKRYVPEVVRFTLYAIKYPSCPKDLLAIHVKNLLSMAELWATKSAFTEIFSPAALSALISTRGHSSSAQRLKIMLDSSRHARRPLELHHHRPIAIRTYIPKFEDSFDPTKHYDPDKERSDAAKFRAEFKKERKGAMRELRKDANFIARQQLKEKKERDQAYEEKYRKLVASIQAEEGQGANEYEREKRARKSKR